MLRIDLSKSLQGPEGPLHLRFKADLAWGERLVLHGPSGAGKTSILRMVAGLLQPDAGTVRLDDQVWQDTATYLPPQRRRCGLVFQQFALFPRMRLHAQLRYAQQQPDEAAITELLSTLGLTAIAQHFPDQLSGGQQQRVAFARALAAQPRVLLLDEPFSAQDAAHAQAMRACLSAFQARTRCITLLVTHATADAIQLGDRVAVLQQGAVVALDQAEAVFGGSLNAEVVQMTLAAGNWQLKVLVNGRLTPWVLPQAQFPALQIGDQVPIHLQN
jgi:molybdate transport system ATP-binding protein